MNERCSACHARLIYRTVDVSDFDHPYATQQVAVRCSNPACHYSDPDQVDYDAFELAP